MGHLCSVSGVTAILTVKGFVTCLPYEIKQINTGGARPGAVLLNGKWPAVFLGMLLKQGFIFVDKTATALLKF
ncbi:MAG: hypothetical protein COX19_09815 [Desulfobacterales bacterium CG23_combo_of_CG06-09_8_20_14_all_51_8]|nr:MAG: hypothetical protein COX19_09815 [Desulfobacterales bacterium CG23_combo_of_CG06-09_8_20_14_all_51_8]